jgi:hypothetical protein
MKNRILLVTTLCVATCFLPQLAAAQSEKTKTFTGIKSIRLNSASGDCKIQRSKDASVTVFVRTTNDFDKSATTKIDQEGDQLILKEDYFERSSRGSAHWTLTVPDGIKIKMTSGSGTITASDVKIDLKATTGSGDLEFSKLSGTIDATSGSGDLTLDNSDGQIEVTVGSGSGSIQNSKGEIKMTTGSGNIRVSDSQAAFTMTIGSGTVTSKNITLSGSSKFTTGSGNTSVSLAASPKYNISLASGSGDAELNFNGHEIAGEIVMQANKKNGRIDAPFAFDKTEEIDDNDNDHVTVKKTVVKGSVTPLVRISTGSGTASLTK